MTSLVLLYRFWSSVVFNESSSVRGERCFSKLGAFMTHNATSPDHWRHFIDWVTLQMWPAALKISQFIDYLFFTPHKVQQSDSKLCRLTAVGTGNKFWFCIVHHSRYAFKLISSLYQDMLFWQLCNDIKLMFLHCKQKESWQRGRKRLRLRKDRLKSVNW